MSNRRRYEDILGREPPKAPHPMPRADRAAQFAPFAALSGHDGAVAEAARLTTPQAVLDDETLRRLNDTIAALRARLRERPTVRVTYFVPDARKDGGAYAIFTGVLRRIDDTARQLQFADGTVLPMDAVCDLCETVDDS